MPTELCIHTQIYVAAHTHYVRTFDALSRNYLYGFVRRCESHQIFLSDYFNSLMRFTNLHFSSIV